MDAVNIVSWITVLLGLWSVHVYGKGNVKWGAIIGLASQPMWLTLGIMSGAWGLTISAAMFGLMHSKNLWKDIR